MHRWVFVACLILCNVSVAETLFDFEAAPASVLFRGMPMSEIAERRNRISFHTTKELERFRSVSGY